MPWNMRPGSAVVTMAAAWTVLAALAPAPVGAQAPPRRTEHVVLIVTDGLRWQEVFGGAERALLTREAGGVADTAATRAAFWRETPEARRATLLPFLWGTIAREGQLYGNPAAGSDARTVNPKKFSYPGYNELLTGAYDPRIDSNGYPPNPNRTVFEWVARQPGFDGRVSAIATWNAFGRIFNAARAGFPVRDGWTPPFAALARPTERQQAIDAMYRTLTRVWPDNAFDAPMHAAALEILRTERPRLLFVGYGETDEWAHAGRYDLLLQAAQRVDAGIAELWTAVQADPAMRGRTTFVITTDHGRGDGPVRWRDHGADVDGAERIWMAVLGPDTPARGDRVRTARITQAQVAATVAALLGLDWPAASPAAAPPVREAVSP